MSLMPGWYQNLENSRNSVQFGNSPQVGLQVLASRAWGKPKQISGNFAKTFSSLFWSFAGFGIRKLPFAGVDKAIGLNPGLARVEFKIPPLVVEYLRVSSALDYDA